MFKVILLFLFYQPLLAYDLPKPRILDKVKNKICDCKIKKQEIDLELFNEPYLKDSLPIFAAQTFGELDRYLLFSKVKIVFRFRF